MRIRIIAVTIAVAALTTLPLAGVAQAQPDRDCPDFATQQEAQAAFDSRPGDPERLDGDDDGYACESRFGEPSGSAPSGSAPSGSAPSGSAPSGSAPSGSGRDSGSRGGPAADSGDATGSTGRSQVTDLPRGAVDTGDGSTAGDTAPPVALLGGLAGVGVGVIFVRRILRRG